MTQVSRVTRSRRSLVCEPLLPLYIGLTIHKQSRSKQLVKKMYEIGNSVSYDRVLQVENEIATATCENMKMKGIVCPVQLRQGLFTVGTLDNIDYNPSNTTAKGSFHGTGISLFQSPTVSNRGQIQDGIRLMSGGKGTPATTQLFKCSSCALPKASVNVPKSVYDIQAVHGQLKKACEQEMVETC